MRLARESDIEELEGRLRAADLVELAAHGIRGRDSLAVGLAESKPCYAIEHEGRCIALFGVTPNPEDDQIGYIWLLGTDTITDIGMHFLRESRKWVSLVSEPYGLVCNVVHEDNIVHVKWLKFLGFKFLRRVAPFIEFARIV